MDEIGCYAQVLYPNVGGFGNQFFLRIPDAELKLACVQAYNDFQLDWISPDPKRFVPVMATPFWDVDAAAKEVERCAAKGHKGVLFTAAPQDFGLPVLADRHWDPLWAAAQDAGLPISFHIGSGDDMVFSKRLDAMGTAPAYAFSSCVLFLNNAIQLSDLLLSGVLSRFPKLDFVSVESGIGWIPFVLEAADYSLEQGDMSDERSRFDLKPSELFHRQVYSCYWFEQGRGAALRERGHRQDPLRDRLPAPHLPVRKRRRGDRERPRQPARGGSRGDPPRQLRAPLRLRPVGLGRRVAPVRPREKP